MTDELFMKECLALANEAAQADEVPVGAVIVRDGKIIATAYNTRETDKCATHHAEVLAIERACKALGGWRLPGCTLYVTMEPCPMCAGAVVNARIERVVWGTDDLRAGAFGSTVNLCDLPLNHKPALQGGILADECRGILQNYFRKKREKAKTPKKNNENETGEP